MLGSTFGHHSDSPLCVERGHLAAALAVFALPTFAQTGSLVRSPHNVVQVVLVRQHLDAHTGRDHEWLRIHSEIQETDEHWDQAFHPDMCTPPVARDDFYPFCIVIAHTHPPTHKHIPPLLCMYTSCCIVLTPPYVQTIPRTPPRHVHTARCTRH